MKASGGQMQRFAVRVTFGLLLFCGHRAWSFVRSIVSNDTSAGLLAFAEPSASLDLVAEHGERLS